VTGGGVVDPRLIESWSRLLASMRASAETIEMLLPFTGKG
jgi:hypothetical protein